MVFGAATFSAVELLVVLVVLGLTVTPGVVTAMKGHLGLFVAGCLVIVVWFIAALRLARPNSWWARRVYGPEKLQRARERYPATDPAAPNRAMLVMGLWFGLLASFFLAGLISALLD